MFVDDVRIVEGDAGLQDAVFQVRLSRDPGVPVTLDFTTVDGSALAGTDFTSQRPAHSHSRRAVRLFRR